MKSLKNRSIFAAALISLSILSVFINPRDATAATNYCVPNHTPTVTSNTTYNSYFNQQTGPGWVGGDSTYQNTLPDGRTVWDFSDTLIGTATADGSATFTGMPHNSLLVGNGANLVSDFGGTYSSPKSLIPDTTSNGNPAWYYMSAIYKENSNLLVYVNQMTQAPGAVFATPTGASAIAVFSMPTAPGLPAFQRLIPIANDTTTQWGNAFTFDSTYNYIYGLTNHQMKLARVRRGYSTLISFWQFWNGTKWVSGAKNAAVINTTEAEAVSPIPANWGTGYIAVSTSAFPGNYLQEQFACSPQGPWSSPQTIYTIPETTGEYHDELAYIPNVVGYKPMDAGTLLVSYNINTTDGFSALMQNVNEYRPRFVTIK